jgi:hypothetical protein
VRHNTVHHIQTTPVTCRPRRLAPDRLAIVNADFDTMLRDVTARRSESSWASALHILPSWRLCGDYRALNARSILDRYSVRHIHDYSHQLSGCYILWKIDLVMAYNQILVHLGDIQKTATGTPFQTLRRFMDDILRGLHFCFACLK